MPGTILQPDYSFVDNLTPMEPFHPLNRLRSYWWLAPPGISSGGRRLLDLRNVAHGSLSSAVSWKSNGSYAGVVAPWTTGALVTYPTSPTSSLTQLSMAMTVTNGSSSGNVVWFTAGGTFPYLGNSGSSWFFEFNSGVGGGTIDAGRHRLMGTFDNGTASIYLDGAFLGSNTQIMASGGTSGSIGGGGGFNASDGVIFEDCTIWRSRCLSASDVALDFQLSDVGYQSPYSPIRWRSSRTWFGVTPVSPPPPSGPIIWKLKPNPTAPTASVWEIY